MKSASFFLILSIFSILSIIPFTNAQCIRAARNKASPPNFLCQLNVTFTRQTDCSALVTETIVFPHTTSKSERRVIQALPDLQKVSELRLLRDGKSLSTTPKQESDGTVTVQLPTESSTTATTFVLSYRLSNAVMRFTDGCGKGEANPLNNIMRWRAGPLDKTVDQVLVTFSTTDDRSLSIIGDGGVGTQKIEIRETDMANEPDFSVEEAGGRLCPADQQCFMRSMPIWQIALIAALVGIPVFLTGTCFFVFLICEVCGVRPDVEGDDPIDDVEMVGFTSGRYSDCIPNHDGCGGCECKKERELFEVQ